MRRTRIFLGLAITLAVFSLMLLHEAFSLKGTLPPAPMHPVETPSPLEIIVRAPTAYDESPGHDWQSGSEHTPKVTVLVIIKNVSDREITLPNFSFWHPGLTFSTHSPLVRKPKFFVSLEGQIENISLPPGKSCVAWDDAADYLTFLVPGIYDLNYSVDFSYSYGNNPAFAAQSQGTVRVHVHANQITWR